MYVDRLPAILRVYVGCAGVLYGDLDDVELVKIHCTSPKVSLMKYVGFRDSRLPILSERIKVNLATQKIDFFSELGNADSQPLYFKSEYVEAGDRDPAQVLFDDTLRQVVRLDENGVGPSLTELESALA